MGQGTGQGQGMGHDGGLPTAILDSLREGFQIIDHDFRYLHVNVAAARHGRTTPDALIGRTMMECYPGIEGTDMFARIGSCLRERTSHVLDNEFTFPDGTTGQFELRIEPVPQGACVLSIDVTARRDMERGRADAELRLAHAQRMEAIGQLAAGVAHDFNNLLTVMLAQGELSLRRAGGPTREQMSVMIDAARAASALTKQLLAYGRRTIVNREPVDLAALVRGLERLLRGSLPSSVELELRVGDSLVIDADRSQLEQIVMNLVLNARDAIAGSGRIIVALTSTALDEREAQRRHDVTPGAHAVLSVTDTGAGIDAPTKQRMFEPFFTTKHQGRGTGLGLSTVYGLVKQHQGDIEVDSAVGAGTTISVYLPLTDKPAREARPSVAAAGEPSPTLEGSQTVLIADDAPLLRKLIDTALQAAGYRVLVAAGGSEALDLWQQHQGSIDLLVTDVVMPGLSGPQLIERLREERPDLPIICTSGYASSHLVDRGAMPAGVAFVEKPFAPSNLVARVRSLLRAS